MSNRMPSLLALLGLAAAAGYQNRDKLRDMLDRDVAPAEDRTSGYRQSDLDGQPRRTGAGLATTLQSGLSELVERFTQSGDDATARSWVGTGQNLAITPDQLRSVLGDGVIGELADKTGLTQIDLLSRLAQALPDTVDQLTPDGIMKAPDRPVQMDEPKLRTAF